MATEEEPQEKYTQNHFFKTPLARETPFECRLPDVFESTIARSNAQRRTNSTKQ